PLAHRDPPPPTDDTPPPAARARPGGTTAPARGRGGSSSRTIKAKFPGRCVCGRSYAAGEPIARNDQGWGHPECRTAAAG
ncbi:ribonuclease HI, partial [Streptomyces anandii]